MLNRIVRVAIAVALMFGCLGQSASAQTISNAATVSLSMTVGESVTITATPASIVFTPTGPTTATSSAPIAVTTAWNLSTPGQSVTTDAYFSSISAALTNGSGGNIPASALFAQINAVAASACTITNLAVAAARPGATCPQVFTQNSTLQGSHTDNITLSINSASQFVPGTFNGVLTISAQVN